MSTCLSLMQNTQPLLPQACMVRLWPQKLTELRHPLKLCDLALSACEPAPGLIPWPDSGGAGS